MAWIVHVRLQSRSHKMICAHSKPEEIQYIISVNVWQSTHGVKLYNGNLPWYHIQSHHLMHLSKRFAQSTKRSNKIPGNKSQIIPYLGFHASIETSHEAIYLQDCLIQNPRENYSMRQPTCRGGVILVSDKQNTEAHIFDTDVSKNVRYT